MNKRPYRKNRTRALLRSRKAQTSETQFNWIFVLIVGALILAFFAFIVMKQKAASEAKFAGKASQMLNTILVGAKVSSGTVQEIETPDLSIRFTCNDYYIGPASRRLGTRVVFAPEYVEGDTIITWTLDWNVPFKVASFLYITTPGVRYVVVADDIGPSSDARWLYNALPEKLTKDIIDYAHIDEIVDENDPYVRIIFVNRPIDSTRFPVPINLVEDVEVTGLAVEMADPVVRRFQFLEKDGDFFSQAPTAPQGYIEDEILFGAVFADDSDEFICLAKRAYARLNVVASVYHKRLNLISPSFARTNCEGLYEANPADGNLDLAAMMAASTSYPLGGPQIAALLGAKDKLEDTNAKAQLRSCPLLY